MKRTKVAKKWSAPPSKSAAGRRHNPVQERSQEMVQTIIAGATRVLAKDGLKGFTTNRVAAAAGISIGSLYQYFANKDEIAMAVVERQHQRVKGLIVKGMVENGNLPVDLSIRSIIASVMHAIHEDQGIYIVLRQKMAGSAGGDLLERLQDDIVELIKLALSRRQSHLKEGLTQRAAFIIVHSLNGVATATLTQNIVPADYAALVADLEDLALSYLLP